MPSSDTVKVVDLANCCIECSPGSPGVMKEAVKLAWVGSSEKTSEPHRQSPLATKLGEASFKAPTFATSDGVSIDVGFMQSDATAIGEICHPVAGSMARPSPSDSIFLGGDGS